MHIDKNKTVSGDLRLLSYVFSICACLDLSVSSSSWCLGGAAVCDCGTPWTFFLPFFLSPNCITSNRNQKSSDNFIFYL